MADEPTLESLQNEILELKDALNLAMSSNDAYASEISELKTSLEDARKLNTKLFLRTSTIPDSNPADTYADYDVEQFIDDVFNYIGARK